MVLDLSQISNDGLGKYRAIYIGGGNTFKLLDEIRRTGFDKKLVEFIKQGGIAYGGSAGAIIMGKNIETVIEEKDRDIDPAGLDLLNGYCIRCHYQDSDNKQIYNFIERVGDPVLAIPEGSGLIITNQNALAVGDEPIVIIKKDQEKIYLQAGESLPLGNPHLSRDFQ